MEVFERSRAITGFFGPDDALHFSMAMGFQDAADVRGDVLEIGSFFGRSTAFLASYMHRGERLMVCDAFELETADRYASKPTISDLRQNIATVTPDFDSSCLDVRNCLSRDLVLSNNDKFRFVHVDGGHSHEEALHDLNLVADHIIVGGVLVVDDYKHVSWPGVTTAVDEFLKARPDFKIIASLNRWIALGQKIYLMRR